ncbi:hypothetical protein [Streptomyces sp. NPDC048392]|uniref:hypothetical protein n=1 Tax=Streptomyces sp. NPDC048392 TaxID=3365543 RepID=UPI0037105553
MSTRDRIINHPGVLATADAEIVEMLDGYRTEVIQKCIGRLRAIPVTCTALTGPIWYGTGWNDAITQLEEIADYQTPDDEAYVGELELLRALALNVRAAARRGDLSHVQQLSDQHHQADKDTRNKVRQ